MQVRSLPPKLPARFVARVNGYVCPLARARFFDNSTPNDGGPAGPGPPSFIPAKPNGQAAGC